MESIWYETGALPEHDRLNQDLKTEVAVIGGGMAGVLTAYFLKKGGAKVVLLEGARIGCGATGKTTAKMTAQHGLTYAELIRKLGTPAAQEYASAMAGAVAAYWSVAKAEEIACDLQKAPAFLYARRTAAPLEEEAHAAALCGIFAKLTDRTELPFAVKGALCFPESAVLHPLKFLGALAKELHLYEHTRAMDVRDHAVITDHGVVEAEKIVIATHFPFLNRPGYYFMRMHQERSYVLALRGAPKLLGTYYGIEEDGYSFRSAGETLLLGGGGHRTGETHGGKYDDLRAVAKTLFPESREVAAWSAQDCATLDGLPYVGRYSASTPDLYVAAGFRKWGMTGSMAAAQSLSEEILHGQARYPLFSPQRFHFSASAKALMDESLQSVKGLTAEWFTLPAEAAEAVSRGQGQLVEFRGQKIGVYKDETGTVHVVPTRCAHLGCQLEWNPDEHSWDCPCHGSRFDIDGRLLDGPALHHLA